MRRHASFVHEPTHGVALDLVGLGCSANAVWGLHTVVAVVEVTLNRPGKYLVDGKLQPVAQRRITVGLRDGDVERNDLNAAPGGGVVSLDRRQVIRDVDQLVGRLPFHRVFVEPA